MRALRKTTATTRQPRRGGLAAAAVAAVAVLLPAAPAAAQDCGTWSQPVLCQVQLVAVDNNFQRVALGGRSGIELAPREQISLQLDARDQFGRRFPSERLAIGYDDRNCGSLLRVADQGEGSLSVAASASQGRCTLGVWVPNNLNFYWEIDFEISAAARTTYSRSEAEVVVNALYAALLGREPDAASFGPAVREVQSGRLEAQINAMLSSAEFRQVISGKTPAQILEQFYQGIFGRQADSGGSRLYLGEMRRGQYASVLLKLIRSPEFERRLG